MIGRHQLLLGLLLLFPVTGWATGPQVVTSIKPVHALVAGVMQGVGEPELLIEGGASPHDYSLRPSDVRNINQAEAVFWIGPALESFLVKPLQSANRTRSVELMDTPGLTLLPIRKAGVWKADRHHQEEEDHHHEGHEHEGDYDTHIWLDPQNAIAMIRHIGTVLGEIDPAHRSQYEKNSADWIQRLKELDRELATQLAPVREVPYFVFHDAYQYFEHRYELNALGAITVSPEQLPGARRVQEIRRRIDDNQARCVFSEPQFKPALVRTLIEGTPAGQGVLDPLGAKLPAGPEAYFQLLRNLADSLGDCLKQ